MNRNTSNRNANNNIWSQRFEIPAWILSIIIIVLILAAIPGIEIPGLLLIAIVILLLIIGLFSGRKSPSGRDIKLSNSTQPDYEITLSNVPGNVTPKLLDIDNEDELRNYDKDGAGEILFIAGNLVFYEGTSDNLATNFPSPIRLTFKYTADDEQKFFAYRKTITGQEVKLIPIYLYSYTHDEDKERPEIHIWKPFQNFQIDEANRTMTIEFLFWGDQQVGGGTRP